jgi:hypothetical protein
LDGARRLKISRREVKGFFIRSIATYPSTRAWNQLYEQAAQTKGPAYED